jgi:hypothetical protein
MFKKWRRHKWGRGCTVVDEKGRIYNVGGFNAK